MDFKKDYINYVLHTTIQNEFYGARDDARVRKILEKIILIPDVAKATFFAGKTAGLEILFKYLLYISDKIDKAHITIFNLKDNFDYDLQNLKRICEEIKSYRSEVSKTKEAEESTEVGKEEVISEEMIEGENAGKEETAEDTLSIEEETAESETGFTLIENQENGSSDEEIFGLAGITRSIEMEEETVLVPEEEPEISESGEEVSEEEEDSIKEAEFAEQPAEEGFEAEDDEILTASDIEKINSIKDKEEKKEELEIEIKDSAKYEDEHADDMKKGSVTSEVYYKFENKFFEEVKILEKLFSNAEKECRSKPLKKLSEKSLQSFSEIIEISSELASLTRQLSLDLTADIFLTINLLFTKAINTPSLINPERTKLLSSSLLLVTSLIKGEDYLGYDELVKKIEALKEELKKPAEQPKKEITADKLEAEKAPRESVKEPKQEAKTKKAETPKVEEIPKKETVPVDYPKEIIEKPAVNISEPESQNIDTVLFKMKYLVKEFEKSFTGISSTEKEYTKFEILDEIDNLNNLLRMLAKISSSVRNIDVLKLSEVSYVFLKYLKDYRMNLLDAEIQQIVKYIIFTYKMLLTDRKTEDFDVLVQYLNNPVKIFTDT